MKAAALQWVEPQPVTIPPDLLEAVGGSPLLAQALLERHMDTPRAAQAFLDPLLYTPAQPEQLPDLAIAAERIEQAIARREPILVWGDFDVDGQTSTAVLVSALRQLGANVSYYIPVRGRETHGVHIPSLEPLLDGGIQLVVTCDTGITAHAAADYARSRGVDLIITDHHSLPPELPNAFAAVNPQRLPENHPLRPLCGVGTAFMLAQALLTAHGLPDAAAELLDLVALGSVADLAALTADNRYLVQVGLRAIQTQPRPAIKSMLELTGILSSHVNEGHIGFTLAPRLNAIGRLGDANPVVPFLLSDSLEETRTFAIHLEALNNRRKMMCDQVFKAALEQVEQNRNLLDDPVLVLNHPAWPGGVLGIVASRLVELYHRPVIMLTAPPGESVRGSARSVEGINITQAIAAQSSLLIGFGGHPMAAGLSLPAEKLEDFRRALNRTVQQTAQQVIRTEALLPIQSYLRWGELSLGFVERLDRLSPYGPGNPPLVLASLNLKLNSFSAIGKTGEHLRLMVEDEHGVSRPVLWWQGAGMPLPEGRFDLAYTVRGSNYRGQAQVGIEFTAFRLISERPLELPTIPKVTVVDYRHSQEDPDELLHTLQQEPASITWAEGEAKFPGGCDRLHLTPAHTLIVWSLPPGRSELQAAIQATQARRVILFAQSGAVDQPNALLTRLAGLVQYTLRNRQSSTLLSELASACAQREPTVRCGLDWLAAQGKIIYTIDENGSINLVADGTPQPEALPRLEATLKLLLSETAAFRNFYRRVEAETLINAIS